MAENLDTAVQLAAIVESSDDAIISKDLNGIVRSWNQAAHRMFGFTAEEMIGQSILKIIPPERQHEEDSVLGSVREALATVEPAADAKGLRITTVIDPHVGPVSGDPNRLQQVLWNLLSNAVKFTARGGRIQVRLEAVNSQVEIVVSDTGFGILPEFLPHIFERFRQAEGGTTRRHGGLGLGLAIARHLVEMHGGTIHAASDGEGKGSTFRVRLPLMIVHAEPYLGDQREHPRSSQRAGEHVSDLDGVRVMAVDDDSDALNLVRDILEAAGARVTTVNSAEAALAKLESERPQVLVADLGMPHMDGFELVKQVRQLSDKGLSAIPAAALTAYARSGDRAKSLRSGFEMHLAKPIDPVELIAAVGALARRQARRRTEG